MKKKVLLLFFISIRFFVFSENTQELNKELRSWKNWCYEYNPIASIARKDNFVILRAGRDEDIIKLDVDKLASDTNGYKYFEVSEKKYLCIYGDRYFFTFDYDDVTKAKGITGNVYPFAFIEAERIDNFSVFLDKIEKFTPMAKEQWQAVSQFAITKIDSSSYYVERLNENKMIVYDALFLHNLLHYDDICDNWIVKSPWVPGKERNPAGIGESLTIEFTESKDNVVILNGYVDPFKRYLYKANNRVKTAVIKSLDKDNPFEIEYTFEDYVHFSEIDFPAKVNKVQFIIKDVYKGEKWNDTCIQAVITRYDVN